jgi:hypothetical protein
MLADALCSAQCQWHCATSHQHLTTVTAAARKSKCTHCATQGFTSQAVIRQPAGTEVTHTNIVAHLAICGVATCVL